MLRWLRMMAMCVVLMTASWAAIAASIDRAALPAMPLLDGRPILFVVRQQYRPDHHNTETMFQTGEINTASFTGGSALKTVDLATGAVKTLLELSEGVVRDPDVSFDGRKILVSIRRNRKDDYHLYELNADGSGLRQLTAGQGVTDIDPIYLPDGRILCHFDPRAEILHVQPAHHGQSVYDGGRRGQHSADRAQHAARGARLAVARRPSDLRSMGVRGSQLRQRPGAVDLQSGRNQSRRLLWQHHGVARRREARSASDSRL